MNAPAFLQLSRWEMRRILSERTGVMLIVLWCGLLALAAQQGQRHVTGQYAEISAARKADEAAWAGKRARLVAIEGGSAHPEAFGDPRSPTNSVMGRSGERPIVLVPTPLATLSGGAGDLAPAVLLAGMITKLIGPAQSIENPANRLAGPLDLTFVVSALLPLFVLALSFDVLARERDAKIWPLLASQPTSLPHIVAARLAVHFAALWLPLVVAVSVSALQSHSSADPLLPTVGEIALWLVIAAGYLLFWQLLAAALNFRAGASASNAVSLAGAWLAAVLLIPSGVDAAVQALAPPPDRREFLLEVRGIETDLFKRADALREAYDAAHPGQRPQGPLNEFDTYFVENLYPRALATDAALAPALTRLVEERAAQARWWRRLAWLSPTLAFRLATEQLAGVTPVQRQVLQTRAKEFQNEMRAVFGAHVASMRPLTLADYDRTPEPSTVRLAFRDRFALAFPSLLGLAASLVAVMATAIALARGNRVPAPLNFRS